MFVHIYNIHQVALPLESIRCVLSVSLYFFIDPTASSVLNVRSVFVMKVDEYLKNQRHTIFYTARQPKTSNNSVGRDLISNELFSQFVKFTMQIIQSNAATAVNFTGKILEPE